MNNESLVDEGVRRAQELGRQGKFKVGQTVAHPSDEFTYEFRGERNGVAVLGLTAKQSPSGKALVKEFPLAEIFDPNVARDEAHATKSEDLASRFPGAIVCRLGG